MPRDLSHDAGGAPPGSVVDVRTWLDAHVNLETGVGVPRSGRDLLAVERIRPLIEILGSPQLDYPSIHVTGTNGKTSVARLTTELLARTGLSVGSYTSPHLEHVNERIAYCGASIDDASLDAQLGIVADAEAFLDSVPSYFEVLTATALRWFGDLAVDAAVVEVGLGGAGDATNVVDGRVAVVTNVSLDHTEYIGPTVDEIAAEKAGIVKPGSVLVLGSTELDRSRPFLAREAAEVLLRDREFGLRANEVVTGGRRLDFFTPHGEHRDVMLSLHGAHQGDNAVAAVAAAEAFLGGPLPAAAITDALGSASSPGRMEVVGERPRVLLDGAHNVAGARALSDALAEGFPAAPTTLVVGLLREKDPLEMLGALGASKASRVVACRAPSPRGRAAEDVADAARALGLSPDRIDIIEDAGRALAHARAVAGPDEQVVVTGSLYVVGAARAAAPPTRSSFRPRNSLGP